MKDHEEKKPSKDDSDKITFKDVLFLTAVIGIGVPLVVGIVKYFSFCWNLVF